MPAFDGVALFAVRAHLPLVDVCVAVRALAADIAEHRFGVALHTAHALVHAAKRILRGVVVEFGNGADRLPAAQGVAVLTGNTKAAVRAAGARGRRRLGSSRTPAGENRQSDHEMQQKCRSQGCPNLK